jgi:8-oxo-dGTP pyrophosphatase MutT (NUDIX family)
MKYSVARACIELRKEEIRGLEWEISLTVDAAKAYQGDRKAMRDFGERKAEAAKFFKHPDPDYWSFDTWLEAVLEEIFVYDALSLVFRPKYGKGLGRGLLGSDLDHIKLLSGPTIRPLVGMHGEKPRPPAPAYQQYLYGVPRSDYMTLAQGTDIDDYGLAGAEVNQFRSDVLLYAPMVVSRETPYGFPPVERALLPIISGLQKQEFQLDYFTEGTVPAVYISPGDPNITPTQIKELQDALNAIAGDPAYHMKVVVLPSGSRVEPQRPVDLSDSFDELVMNQVCMAFDVQPVELGIIPAIGGGSQGPSASALRMAAQASRDIKQRKSTKPLLMFLVDIFNYVLQDICGQQDMQFGFEGLVDDEDKQAITELGVQQVQNGIASVDEVRERLDMAPWGLETTSEPVVFTAQGPIPFAMAPELIRAAMTQPQGAGGQGTNSGQKKPSSKPSSTTGSKQPTIRAGGQTKPNGSHPAPVSPHREGVGTPAHAAAQGAIQSPTPRTGGTRNRSPVAGSRKKAVASELDALGRHLRKGRDVASWEPVHVPEDVQARIVSDIGKGVLIDTALGRAQTAIALGDTPDGAVQALADVPSMGARRLHVEPTTLKVQQWPGWQHDLGLVGAYKELISDAFHAADAKGAELRKKAATGQMYVSMSTLRGLIVDEARDVFLGTLTPLWEKAWHLGYASAKALVTGQPADFTARHESDHLDNFLATEGEHWLDQMARTGLGNSMARSGIIARTEVARAVNTAALQCYKDSGVAYKHLLLAPDDTCDICKGAASDGVIPLDANFSAGGTLGFCHPQCRCVPAPAGVNAEPPQAHIGKADDPPMEAFKPHGFIRNPDETQPQDICIFCHRYKSDQVHAAVKNVQEDPSKVSFLMIRARDPEDAKWRYLLQKRGGDGTWGLPGGTHHVGEDPWQAAFREATEEMGDLPPLVPKVSFTHRRDGKLVHVFLAESPYFHPRMNGATPEETAGAGWFRRKEVGDLDLHPNFRDQWESIDWQQVAKTMRQRVNENGERIAASDAEGALEATGLRWPYPHRADGAEAPEGVEGSTEGEMGAAEPPHWDDFTTGPRNPFPSGDDTDEMWPPPRNTLQSPGTSIPGKAQQGEPVVGSVPAKTPKPMSPGSVPPEAFDPADTVEHWSDADESNVAVKLPPARKK